MADPILCRSAALTGFVDLARKLGLNPWRLAEQCGVPPDALADPDLRVPAAAVGRLLEAAARQSGTPDFGMRLSETRRLSNMGLLAIVAREQPNLRKALQVMAQYQYLQNEAISLVIEETGDTAVLKLVGARTRRGSARQAIELSVGVLCNNMRALIGRRWHPEMVCFTHRASDSLGSYRRVFGVKPYFEQPFDGVAFARATLDEPLADADPELARQVTRQLEQLSGARQSRTMRHKVEDLITLMLPTGGCSVGKAARHLGVDRRTVHRKLKDESTTYSQLIETARRRLAATLLAERERPIREIAEALGFSSTSAFSRWYRKAHARTARSLRQ